MLSGRFSRSRRAGRPKRILVAAMGAVLPLVLMGSSTSRADGPTSTRGLLSPARKPAAVPSNYVLTHNGFFHPSCVVTVASGDVIGSDGVVRGPNGAEHARFSECLYPRFSLHGRAMDTTTPSAAPVASAHAPPLEAAAATYDGYIVWYSYNGPLAVGTMLTTDWTVPLEPAATDNQDIAFFNDILTSAGGGDILQPVLDYNGEVRNHWAIESEHCCISGNDMQTTPIDVDPGDAIRGTVTGTGCDSTGVCQGWTVTTADMTNGQSTTLSTTAPMGTPNGVSPGSLETYGVTACDLFPANGEVVFTDNVATGGDGGIEKLAYQLTTLQNAAAEVPTNCGYGGASSGTSFTLIFGPVDGGTSGEAVDAGGGPLSGGGADAGSSAGARDAAAPLDARVANRDASVEGGVEGAAEGGMGGGAREAGGASSDAAIMTIADASIVDTGNGGAPSGGGGSSSGAVAPGEGGVGAANLDAGGAADVASSGSGCQCDVVASGGSSGAWMLLGAIAGVVGTTRRRRRTRTVGPLPATSRSTIPFT